MLRKKFKKAFTLVELVVVIAIIAILAGVSVAVYVGITNKAKAAADSEIVSQLNTQMRAKSVIEGRNKTAYDAYLDAKEAGFDLELLKPQTGGKYVWDEENDLFACVELNGNKFGDVIAEDKTTSFNKKVEKGWVFTNTIAKDAQFSQYMNEAGTQETVEVIAGFDAGKNTKVKEVTYKRTSDDGQEVVIRTNSYDTSLRINAALDTVNHYGVLGDLVIEKVAMASYDEYGRVGGTCLITEGRIVVADEGEMTSIAVNNKDTSKVEVATSGNGTVGVVFVATKEIAEEMDKPTNKGVNDWFYNYTDAEGNPIELPENATDEQVTEYINTVIERINEIATSSVVYVKETNIYYDDIRDAVSAAANGQTIILVRDTFVEYKDKCYIRIDYGKELTFDLNGHMLTANTAVAGNTALIDNRGTLTIQDSTDKKCDGSGSGLLTNIATKADDKGVPGYASNTIKNNNILYIKSGTVQNATTGGAAAYAVDCDDRNDSCPAGVGMKLYITGGRLLSNSQSIRMYLQSSRDNYAEISNARIGGLWIQDSSNSAEKGTLKINNSIFDSIKIGYYGGAGNVNVEIKNSKINNLFNYCLDSSKTGNTLTLENNEFGGFLMDNEAKVLTNGTFKLVEGSEINIGWVGADGTFTPEQMQEMKDEYASQGIRCGEQYNDEAWWQGYANATAQKRFIENCIVDGYKLQDNGNGTYTIVKK